MIGEGSYREMCLKYLLDVFNYDVMLFACDLNCNVYKFRVEEKFENLISTV